MKLIYFLSLTLQSQWSLYIFTSSNWVLQLGDQVCYVTTLTANQLASSLPFSWVGLVEPRPNRILWEPVWRLSLSLDSKVQIQSQSCASPNGGNGCESHHDMDSSALLWSSLNQHDWRFFQFQRRNVHILCIMQHLPLGSGTAPPNHTH